jgi:hypothetical protein
MRRPTAGAPAPRARLCRAARRYLLACPRKRELRSGPQPPRAAAGRSHGPAASCGGMPRPPRREAWRREGPPCPPARLSTPCARGTPAARDRSKSRRAAYAVARHACVSSVTEGWTGCARRGPSCETRCCGGARPTSRPGRSSTRANEARRRRGRSRRPSRRPRGAGTRSSPEMCDADSRGARAPPGGSAFLVKECWP